jgi:ribosomal protein S18 acetylase RimI-like enzyme
VASSSGLSLPGLSNSEPPRLPAQTGWLARVRLHTAGQADLVDLEWGGEYTHFRRMYGQVFLDAQKGKAIIWVAQLPSAGLIGQVFVHLHSLHLELANGVTRAYLYGFRIKPPYRRQGLGSLMLRTVEADLLKRGYTLVTLNVARDNPDARRFYERYGYQVVGDEPGRWSYLDDQGLRRDVYEPAYRMEKRI